MALFPECFNSIAAPPKSHPASAPLSSKYRPQHRSLRVTTLSINRQIYNTSVPQPQGMRAARAPPSPSLLTFVCRQPSGTLNRTPKWQCLRPSGGRITSGSSRGYAPFPCSAHAPACARFFSATSAISGKKEGSLWPTELFSWRQQAGGDKVKGIRGFFGRKKSGVVEAEPISPSYLDSGTENSIVGRHLLHKPNDMVLRCTEFDQDGMSD